MATYPSSHRIETNGNTVTLYSGDRECLTLTNPKWNGVGNLLTYMVKVRMIQLMQGKKFDINQY